MFETGDLKRRTTKDPYALELNAQKEHAILSTVSYIQSYRIIASR